jgi:transcriptional regulator with XRE-family HTH domain
MKYEKARFVNNIYELAKRQKLKIGDLETNCGVSNGYLARLRQDDKNTAPGADFLMNIADQLSVSVDALLSFDFPNSTGAEQKLLIYIDRLLRDTEARKLIWQRDPAPLSVPVNPDASSAHPLFVAKTGFLSEEEMAEDELPDTVMLSEMVYRSVFHPDLDDLCPSEIYRCTFPGKKALYLVSVAEPGPDVPGPARWAELELVMAVPGQPDPIPFVHTDHDWPGCLDQTLTRLFSAVQDAVAHPHLSPEASAFIDDYLR